MYRLSQAKVPITEVPPITGQHDLLKCVNHKRTTYHGSVQFTEVSPITGQHDLLKEKAGIVNVPPITGQSTIYHGATYHGYARLTKRMKMHEHILTPSTTIVKQMQILKDSPFLILT